MLALFKKKKKEKLPARQRGNSCLNCEVILDGNENYCPECGQRNNINQLNFKLVLDEFIGNLITYDSRVWHTAVPLIMKPGKVAYEFISGKRKQYVNPFRTYLTVSLIFFLVYGLLGKISELKDGEKKLQANIVNFDESISNKKDSLTVQQKDSIAKATLAEVQKSVPIDIDSTLKANNVNLDSLNAQNTDLDSLKDTVSKSSPFFKKLNAFYDYHKEHEDHSISQALDSLGYENTFWNRFYYDKAKDSHAMMEDRGESFNDQLFSNLSLAIFLFLPIFALFLKFIYLRRKYTYMEHMVFVFYTQSVFFLLLLLFIFIHFFSNGNETLFLIAVGLFSIYLFIAMKNFLQTGMDQNNLKILDCQFCLFDYSYVRIGRFNSHFFYFLLDRKF